MKAPLEHLPELLVVDLDDTLIKGDLLIEMAFLLLLKNPLRIFPMVLEAARGPLALKRYLSDRINPDPKSLLYRESVLEWIGHFRASNRRVVLASASPEAWVKSIAEHLGCFDEWAGSSQKNLKGAQKLEWIQKYWSGEFAYAGDSVADEPIFKAARLSIAVNPGAGTLAQLKEHAKSGTNRGLILIEDRSSMIRALIRALRPHQWAKNILLALPLLAAHQDLAAGTLAGLVKALVSFSLIASSVYLLNDLSDRQADRLHPSKRKRPIASGDVPILLALSIMVLLLFVSFYLGGTISPGYLGCLAVYLLSNLAYTFFLKRLPMLDVVVLSGMYTLRILAGGQATATPISEWLLIFSTFFFMGLALVKRHTEVSSLVQKKDKVNEFGRGYAAEDAGILLGLGLGCSLLSVLVVALYLNSPKVAVLYSRPERLSSLVPLLLYWVGRIWLLAGRKKVQDDPVSFALKDPVSWVVGGVALAILKYAL
jgi:4-hydroxybenzoate polyprenyltransferase/phosphoserine phosphatase